MSLFWLSYASEILSVRSLLRVSWSACWRMQRKIELFSASFLSVPVFVLPCERYILESFSYAHVFLERVIVRFH